MYFVVIVYKLKIQVQFKKCFDLFFPCHLRDNILDVFGTKITESFKLDPQYFLHIREVFNVFLERTVAQPRTKLYISSLTWSC